MVGRKFASTPAKAAHCPSSWHRFGGSNLPEHDLVLYLVLYDLVLCEYSNFRIEQLVAIPFNSKAFKIFKYLPYHHQFT